IFYEKWLVRYRKKVETLEDQGSIKRKYYNSGVHIWLHRAPYEDFRKRPARPPLLLGKTKMMRVMVPQTQESWPRLPLLGLEALMANGLRLSVLGESSRFLISKTIRQ